MLARIDLRGTADVRAALRRDPRPPNDDVADVVAAILTDVQTGGDAALRALNERFNGWGGDIEIAADECSEALRARRSRAARGARVRPRPDRRLARTAGQRRTRTPPLRGRGARAGGSRRPGRVLRARRPGPAPLVGADDRAAGTHRRRRAHRVVHPAAARRERSRRDPRGGRLAGVDVVYRVGGAQAIAALAYGTETIAAVDVIVGPGTAYTAEAKRQVRRCRRRSTATRARPRLRSSPTRRRRPCWSPPTCSPRPSTGPADRRRSSRGTRRSRARSSASCALRLAHRRDDAEGRSRAAGGVLLVDGPAQAMRRRRTRSHPSTSSSMCADAEDARAAGSQRGRGVRRDRRIGGDRRLRGGCQPRACPPAAPLGYTDRAAGRRLPQARARR